MSRAFKMELRGQQRDEPYAGTQRVKPLTSEVGQPQIFQRLYTSNCNVLQ